MPKGLMTAVIVPRWPLYVHKVAAQCELEELNLKPVSKGTPHPHPILTHSLSLA